MNNFSNLSNKIQIIFIIVVRTLNQVLTTYLKIVKQLKTL